MLTEFWRTDSNRIRHLFFIALEQGQAAGIIAENAVLAIVDAVMGFAVDMLKTGKRLARIKNLITESWYNHET